MHHFVEAKRKRKRQPYRDSDVGLHTGLVRPSNDQIVRTKLERLHVQSCTSIALLRFDGIHRDIVLYP